MYPRSFTEIGPGHYKFHYDQEEWNSWYNRGLRHGDVGLILAERKGILLRYIGFGTIENPVKHIRKISIVHNPHFDGPLRTPEELCKLPENPFKGWTFGFAMVGPGGKVEEFGKHKIE
jgi:hypothetical protein